MLCTLNEVLNKAHKERYAVGLFNTTNLEMAVGVIRAAEELNSPVIIGTAEILLPAATLSDLAMFLIPMAKRASVPVVVHFDHGLSEKKIKEAIGLGFTSIMYDCSANTYEDNVEKVGSMAEFAHSCGVTIEGELGQVGANPDATEGSGEASIYTKPEQAKAYAENTKVDALAISIGNAHGPYLKKPCLNLDILRSIRETIDIPLVLHGGSGLSDNDFRACVENGISKVNIFTDINHAAVKAVCDNYRDGKGMSDLSPYVVEAVKKETMKKMRLFGSMGKGVEK